MHVVMKRDTRIGLHYRFDMSSNKFISPCYIENQRGSNIKRGISRKEKEPLSYNINRDVLALNIVKNVE